MKNKRNVGFVYFVAFLFLFVCIFGGLGHYNSITSAATTDTSTLFDSVGYLSDAMRGVMKILVEGIIEPVLGYSLDSNETASYVLRGLIFFFLLVVLNTVFAKNDNFKKYSWILAALVAFAAAAFFPKEILDQGQNLLGSLVIIALIIITLINVHKWDLPAGWKSFVFLILLIFIFVFNGLITDFGAFSGFYNTAFLLSVAASAIAMIFYGFKAFSSFGGGGDTGGDIGLGGGGPRIRRSEVDPFEGGGGPGEDINPIKRRNKIIKETNNLIESIQATGNGWLAGKRIAKLKFMTSFKRKVFSLIKRLAVMNIGHNLSKINDLYDSLRLLKDRPNELGKVVQEIIQECRTIKVKMLEKLGRE